MKMDMRQWIAAQIHTGPKKPLPLLSFPCVQLMGISVKELISDSRLQAEGMAAVARLVDSAAAVSLMDLSLEAEAFGSPIRVSQNEVPTVTGVLITGEEDAAALEIPSVGAGRTGICIDAIRQASALITDRPVLAGVIGPYSLAGRLMDVSEIMILCYEEPELVHTVMEKVTEFLIRYCRAYKAAGANGVVMAEPLTGLLSPALAREFSHPYVKKIIDSVQTDDFILIYHNCGDNVPLMAEDIYGLGAAGCHFGDAISLAQVLPLAPEDMLVLGNVSPTHAFLKGTPDSVRRETQAVMEECCRWPNFLLSSGCDIPPAAPIANIEAFFSASKDFYA